jgi:uncharacterized OB-fold protein
MSWPAPVEAADMRPFWAYAREYELRAQRCADCGHLRLPAGPLCPRCWSERDEWVALSGRGELQSWVVYRRQYHEAFRVPFAVGLVELDEGPRLEAALVDVKPEALRWRMPVELAWRKRETFVLPCFRPVSRDRKESA